MIPLICPECKTTIEHKLGDDETMCKCGFVLKIRHRVNAKSIEALKTLEDGFYWFSDAGNKAEPVEFRQDGENVVIYCIGSEIALWIPHEINEGSYLYTPKLVSPDHIE